MIVGGINCSPHYSLCVKKTWGKKKKEQLFIGHAIELILTMALLGRYYYYFTITNKKLKDLFIVPQLLRCRPSSSKAFMYKKMSAVASISTSQFDFPHNSWVLRSRPTEVAEFLHLSVRPYLALEVGL